MRIASMILAAGLLPLGAQEIKMPAGLDRLSEKAEQAVDVTMNKSMLQMAARFLSDRDGDEAKTKAVLAGLDSVTVRSFEFRNDGEYNPADVDAFRAQLQAPAWSRIVGVKSKRSGESAEVYFKNAANGQRGGVVVIAAEARELTIVNVVGTLDPGQLAGLSGHFGIPRLDLGDFRMGNFERRERR